MNQDNKDKHSNALGMNDPSREQQKEFEKNTKEDPVVKEMQEHIMMASETATVVDDLVFDRTDRELFNLTLALYRRMDSSYQSQFLDNV